MKSSILESYYKIIEFLGYFLGPDYEIVLQDAKTDSPSILAIVNNHISGRMVGSPVSDLSLDMIKNKVYLHSDYQVNYNSMTKDNKIMRSSTFFIKEKNELVGMLCINFDSTRYLHMSKEILRLCHPDHIVDENYNFDPSNNLLDISENFTGSVSELTDAVLESSFLGSEINTSNLSKEEKLHVVDVLNKKGVFLIKGAVSQVALKLNCSDASIYRYLNKINK